MFGTGDKQTSLVATTIKGVAAVAVMFWLAANWLSSATDRAGLTQLAAKVGRGEEPTTTGSIGQRAASTKLDPCVLLKR